MKRLHLIEFLISDYIKYEYYSYYLSNYLGEFIKYNDIKKYNNIPLKDFVIFDNKYLLIHDYGKEGRIKGAWYLTEETTNLQELVTWYDASFRKVKYFQGIMKPDKNILDLIL